MLATYCENEGCKEYGIAKEVPEDFEDLQVTCGICGEQCVENKNLNAKTGEKVAGL